jgi:hypothetical protein
LLLIRSSQLAVFEEARLRQFVRKLADLLIARYPALTEWSQTELLAELESRCWIARRYGLETEAAIGDFVDLTLQLGDRFHEYPAVRAVLLDPEIPAQRRLQVLLRSLTPPQWEAIRRFSRKPRGPGRGK